MFGHKSLPARQYAYFCMPPTQGLDLFNRQVKLAHEYRSVLVKLEIERRAEVIKRREELFPEVTVAKAVITEAKKELDAARTALGKANSAAREKNSDPVLVEAIRVKKADFDAACLAEEKVRKKVNAVPAMREVFGRIEEDYKVRRKDARHTAAAAGLMWGNYNFVEGTVETTGPTPPHSWRWDGTGRITVQVQNGISAAEAHAGTDRRVKISPGVFDRLRAENKIVKEAARTRQILSSKELRQLIDEREERFHKNNFTVWVRVGSDGRKPVWMTLPIKMERPIPPTALIKFVYVIRSRVADRDRWSVNFVLTQEKWESKNTAKDGAVAIATGFRRVGSRGLRVAYWEGSDGKSGEFLLAKDKLKEWLKCDELQGIRDDNFNEAMGRLKAWLAMPRGIGGVGPLTEEFQARIRTVANWKGQVRLAVLCHYWRENRQPGDAEIYAYLAGGTGTPQYVSPGKASDPTARRYFGWLGCDYHLWQWQTHLRKQMIDWRNYTYRHWLIELSRKYQSAIVANLNWSDLVENPEIGDDEETIPKKYFRFSAPATLRELAKNYFTIEEVDHKRTMIVCHVCDAKMKDPGAAQMVDCPKCGQIDRAVNVARNLLRWGMAETEPEAETGGPESPPEPQPEV